MLSDQDELGIRQFEEEAGRLGEKQGLNRLFALRDKLFNEALLTLRKPTRIRIFSAAYRQTI